jgi:serine protease Do
MALLEDLSAQLQTIETDVGPAVVGIGRRRGTGSGVVIDGGRVLTNAHHVHDDVVAVRLHDGTVREGAVVAVDVDADLAVLAVDTTDLPAVRWADDLDVRVGAPVFGLSRPRSGPGVRVTFGTVAATGRGFRGPQNRPIAGAFEHTAPLARGASGGPVVAADGTLLGINTHRMGEGFYLAQPADTALRERVDQLVRGQAPQRRQLGVALAPPHVARRLRAAVGLPERDGLLVQQVFDDTPAAASDLRRGDLIVAVDGTAAASADVLYAALARAGDTLTLGVVRGTDDIEVVVSFADGRA